MKPIDEWNELIEDFNNSLTQRRDNKGVDETTIRESLEDQVSNIQEEIKKQIRLAKDLGGEYSKKGFHETSNPWNYDNRALECPREIARCLCQAWLSGYFTREAMTKTPFRWKEKRKPEKSNGNS